MSNASGVVGSAGAGGTGALGRVTTAVLPLGSAIVCVGLAGAVTVVPLASVTL